VSWDRRSVFVVTAFSNGCIALAECVGAAFVEISATGWKNTAGPGVLLQISRSALSIPEPAPPPADALAPLDTLRSCLNPPTRTAWLRCLACVLSRPASGAAFRPAGPYPILILQGRPGSAKFFAARVLRSLVDPSIAPLTPSRPPSATSSPLPATTGPSPSTTFLSSPPRLPMLSAASPPASAPPFARPLRQNLSWSPTGALCCSPSPNAGRAPPASPNAPWS
jgi:hypothetical protein